MSEEVVLYTAGTVDLEDLRSFLEEKSVRPATLDRHGFYDEPGDFLSFGIAIHDPFDRRKTREIRGHVSERVGDEIGERIGNGTYTRVGLGEFGNAEKIVTLIAKRYGGCMLVESRDEIVEFDAPSTGPTSGI